MNFALVGASLSHGHISSFDYNSMKLGHIITYNNVFKFQNGPYRTKPSGVIALCLMTIPYLYEFGNSGASVSHGHISSLLMCCCFLSLLSERRHNWNSENISHILWTARRYLRSLVPRGEF